MPFIESFQEFQARMNCPYRPIAGRYLFSNAGQSDGTHHEDPPADEWQVLRLRGEFVADKLREEVAAFRDYKNAVTEQAAMHSKYHNLPPAPSDAPAKLRAGQARIAKLRQELTTIGEQLAESPEAQARREHAAAIDAERARENELVSRIMGIEI